MCKKSLYFEKVLKQVSDSAEMEKTARLLQDDKATTVNDGKESSRMAASRIGVD
jgi:hypothetical protein